MQVESGETTQILFDMKNKRTITIQNCLKKHLLSFEKEDSIELK